MYVLFLKFCDNINFFEFLDLMLFMEILIILNLMFGCNKIVGKYV